LGGTGRNAADTTLSTGRDGSSLADTFHFFWFQTHKNSGACPWISSREQSIQRWVVYPRMSAHFRSIRAPLQLFELTARMRRSVTATTT